MRSIYRAASIATISALTAVFLTVVAPPAYAERAGDLDLSFSGDGKQIVSTGVDMYAQEVLVTTSTHDRAALLDSYRRLAAIVHAARGDAHAGADVYA